MWIIIRLLIGIAILFASEFYFTNKSNQLCYKTFFSEVLCGEIPSCKKNISNLDKSLSTVFDFSIYILRHHGLLFNVPGKLDNRLPFNLSILDCIHTDDPVLPVHNSSSFTKTIIIGNF